MNVETIRPALPPESQGRRTPTFQFPKSLCLAALRPLVWMQELGLTGRALQRHIVICGFPRSGTTLCQLMIESCVGGLQSWGRERRALEAARFAPRRCPTFVTKRPKDIFLIPEIRDYYQSQQVDVRFILLNRDPRAVLTSVHFSDPSRYYLSVREWRHIYAHWKWSQQGRDVQIVRYEDLVCEPDHIEQTLQAFSGWQMKRPFREFLQNVPNGFDTRALNGLRELDPLNVNRWQDDKHRVRMLQLLCEMPELPKILIELGYETDHSWTASYMADSQRLTRYGQKSPLTSR